MFSGYAAPEYIATGNISEKADVYNFGVVLLEIICAKPFFFSHSMGHLLDYVSLFFLKRMCYKTIIVTLSSICNIAVLIKGDSFS
jgi:hypothetical protein